jgi:LysM repeat protein
MFNLNIIMLAMQRFWCCNHQVKTIFTANLFVIIFALSFTQPVNKYSQLDELAITNPFIADGYTLIAEVNSLRAAHGLPGYNVHPILMQIAQAHSAYQASIGTVTHYGADGSRPYQRALAAGYPVAGDLSLGGIFSENIMAGPNLTPKEAVAAWQGDAPHLSTMLSPNFNDVGAGIAVVGSYVYYTLDVGLASGSPVPYTPSVGETPGAPVTYVAPVSVNTPLEDGSIIHIVKPGETLWSIAAAYGVKVDDVRSLNKLWSGALIYPGSKLIIRLSVTKTPVPPTPTTTRRPTPTRPLYPTATGTVTLIPTPVPAAAAPNNETTLIVLGIVVLSLSMAGVLTWVSDKHAS